MDKEVAINMLDRLRTSYIRVTAHAYTKNITDGDDKNKNRSLGP